MVVKNRVFKLPDGRIVSKREHQRLQRQRQQRQRGNVIPHAENPGQEKYDMTYRGKGRREPASSKLPYDFCQ